MNEEYERKKNDTDEFLEDYVNLIPEWQAAFRDAVKVLRGISDFTRVPTTGARTGAA